MANNIDIPGVPIFDMSDNTSLSQRWKRWMRCFTFYIDAKGLAVDKQKKALLLHSAGPEVQDIFETLADPGVPGGLAEGQEDTATDYEKAVRTLDSHFIPTINTPYERHVFRKIAQTEGETMDQYVARLKQQAVNCEFGAGQEEHIRDQIIDKCKSNVLRRKFLEKGKDLTLTKLQEISRAMEVVNLQARTMESNPRGETTTGDDGQVNYLGKKGSKSQRGRPRHPRHSEKHSQSDKHSKPDKNNARGCFRCGNEDHFYRDPNCPAKDKTCKRCSLKGHYAHMCKTKLDKQKGASKKHSHEQGAGAV